MQHKWHYTFDRCYNALEERFRRQVEEDRQIWKSSVYLPSIRPIGPVEFLLVGMEPSLGLWAADQKEAEEKIEQGFKDFAFSIGDFILHYTIRKYLCSNGKTYHITNLSKGAMLVSEARIQRRERYERWYPLFQDEVRLVFRETTRVVAIGNAVADFLKRMQFEAEFGRSVEPIMHYSSQAARYRNKPVIGKECEFREFKTSVGARDIPEVAKAVISECRMTEQLASVILKRANSYTQLTESQKKLIFGYKIAFQKINSDKCFFEA